LSIYLDTHATGNVEDAVIERAVPKVRDLSPTGIRKHLDLNKPIYAKTAAYGHFGRKPGRGGTFSWEKIDLIKALKNAVKS
jgi:S-adenosylmethionine synthetase